MATTTATVSSVHLILTVTEVAGSVNAAANTSQVHWTLTAQDSYGASWSSTATSGTVSINGTGHGYSYSWSSAGTQTRTLSSGTVTVTHNSDGSLTMPFSFTWSGIPGTSIGSASNGSSMVLTKISRASIPTVMTTDGSTKLSSAPTGYTCLIETHRADPTYTHDIQPVVNGVAQAYLAQKTTAPNINWTIPDSVLSAAPNQWSCTVTVYVITYDASGTYLGRNSYSFTLFPGTGAYPNAGSMQLAVGGASASLGAAVQGHSTLTLTPSGQSAQYGATVKSITATVDGQTLSVPGTTANLSSAGTLPVTWIVTDSRGAKSTGSSTVGVAAYALPQIVNAVAERANADGTPNDQGTTGAIIATTSVASIQVGGIEKNTRTVTISFGPHGQALTSAGSTTPAGASAAGTYLTPNSLLTTESWDVSLTVADALGGSATQTLTISTADIFMDWDGSAGIGLGKYRESGMLDVAGEIYQAGHVVLDDTVPWQLRTLLPDPQFVYNPAVVGVTTSWAPVSGIAVVSLTVANPCWVRVVAGAWLENNTAGNDTRMGIVLGGATVMAANQTQAGANDWGNTGFTALVGTAQVTLSRLYLFAAGTTTVTLSGMGTGTGTHQVNYPSLQVVPERWA